MSRNASVAVVTCDEFPQLFKEESELKALLEAHDLRVEVVRWSDPVVPWNRFGLVLLRSTWDYFERIDEFRGWLNRLESGGVRLQNPYRLVRWNMDKRYLAELEQKGARIVPTCFLEQGQPVDLEAALAAKGWDRGIIKPTVSGGAFRTHLVEPGRAREHQGELDAILQGTGALIQPFVPEIQTEGEWSLFFFGGVFSHSVLKIPATDDFRVQPQFGGRFESAVPDPVMQAEALQVLRLLPVPPLYVRVDGVCVGGQFCLMEVEAIEPYLFTAAAPGALERFAGVVAKAV